MIAPIRKLAALEGVFLLFLGSQNAPMHFGNFYSRPHQKEDYASRIKLLCHNHVISPAGSSSRENRKIWAHCAAVPPDQESKKPHLVLLPFPIVPALLEPHRPGGVLPYVPQIVSGDFDSPAATVPCDCRCRGLRRRQLECPSYVGAHAPEKKRVLLRHEIRVLTLLTTGAAGGERSDCGVKLAAAGAAKED